MGEREKREREKSKRGRERRERHLGEELGAQGREESGESIPAIVARGY